MRGVRANGYSGGDTERLGETLALRVLSVYKGRGAIEGVTWAHPSRGMLLRWDP